MAGKKPTPLCGMASDAQRLQGILRSIHFDTDAERDAFKVRWLKEQDEGGREFWLQAVDFHRVVVAYQNSSNAADRGFAETVLMAKPIEPATFAWARKLRGPRPPLGRAKGTSYAVLDAPLIPVIVRRARNGEKKTRVALELAAKAAGAGSLESKKYRLLRYPEVRRL